MTRLALPTAAIVELGAGPVVVALLVGLNTGASGLLGPLAGVWVDRLPRRSLMVACDLIRLAVVASAPIAAAVGALTLAHLCLVALLLGGLTALGDTGALSYTPALVHPRDVGPANAKLVGSRSVAQIAGSATGGLLVNAAGGARAMAADALSYGLSALLVARIRTPDPPPTVARRDAIAELREGLAVVRDTPALLGMARCHAAVALALGVRETLFLVFAYTTLGLGAVTVGAALALSGVGAILGSLLAQRAPRRSGHVVTLALGAALPATSLLVLPIAHHVWAAGVLALSALLSGAGLALYSASQLTLRQEATPYELLGRVGGINRAILFTPMLVGAAVAGALAGTIGTTATLTGAGAALALALPALLAPLARATAVPAR